MTRTERVAKKLRRARRRGAFRTADLFAGCGGLSLGFERAGFRSVLAIERDESALESHILNFAQLAPRGEYAAHADICKTPPTTAVDHLIVRGNNKKDAVDILIAGPPCQAFSRLGRAALWGIAGNKRAHADDPRATLYEYFLAYIKELEPLAFVMENVPEMGNFDGENIAERIAVATRRLGYVCRYALLNAAWYGVPQYRERLFIIGIRRELGIAPTFPAATHSCTIPKGYATSRAGSKDCFPVLEPRKFFVDFAPEGQEELPKAPSAWEALCDLPRLRSHLTRESMPRGLRTMQFLRYGQRTSWFTEAMRTWPGFGSLIRVDGHSTRHTPRDYPLFKEMREGDMYPDALAIAHRRFRRQIAATARRLGRKLDGRSTIWKKLRRAIVPPYAVTRYTNKYRKMARNEPVHTVPAHLGKDCYSHIHFDSEQARAISVRDAARLQSFPDGFLLSGGMNAQFTQIGNAVPPLLAHAVAKHLRLQLEQVRGRRKIRQRPT